MSQFGELFGPEAAADQQAPMGAVGILVEKLLHVAGIARLGMRRPLHLDGDVFTSAFPNATLSCG